MARQSRNDVHDVIGDVADYVRAPARRRGHHEAHADKTGEPKP